MYASVNDAKNAIRNAQSPEERKRRTDGGVRKRPRYPANPMKMTRTRRQERRAARTLVEPLDIEEQTRSGR